MSSAISETALIIFNVDLLLHCVWCHPSELEVTILTCLSLWLLNHHSGEDMSWLALTSPLEGVNRNVVTETEY